MTGADVPDNSENAVRRPDDPIVYQVTTQLWIHAEQIRWTLLYNYLLATSILLLAWATLFAPKDKAIATWYVLEGL